MTSSTPTILDLVDPTSPDHLHLWFDPTRLGRGDLMKAMRARKIPVDVSHTNINMIEALNAWLDANNVQRPVIVEVDEDGGDDLDLDDLPYALPAEEAAEAPSTPTPAAGVNSASTPAAGTPKDAITVSRAEWDRMQALLERLASGQAGATAKPLDEVVAAPARTGAGGMPQKTGVFPGGYRAEHIIGPRAIDDATHFALIEATHNEAVAAGHRTKGAPLAGLRIGYSADDRGMRTAVYEVAIFKE